MTFTNRWQHRMTLTFRAWPREARAHKLSVMAEEWSVDGMTYNRNEHLEVVHRIGQKGFAAWELSDEDAATLSLVGDTGAKIERMRVRCPGTMANTYKKECWLEAEILVYPDAVARIYGPAGRKTRTLACPWDELEDLIKKRWSQGDAVSENRVRNWTSRERYAKWKATYEPRTFSGFEVYISAQVINLEEIARKILAGKVVVFKDTAVSAELMAELRDKLNYFTFEGRKPDEPGGLLKGYQLGDGIIRWTKRTPKTDPDYGREGHMRKMHQKRTIEGQERRRTIFVGEVVEGVARKYGISHQTVMSVFLAEGLVDYLMRSYDAAAKGGKLYVHGIPRHDLRGFVSEAVRVVSFFIEGITEREVA